MQPQEFYIPTAWRIKGRVEQVYDLAPLLKPVFAWNHRWAMQRGYEELTCELPRRANV